MHRLAICYIVVVQWSYQVPQSASRKPDPTFQDNVERPQAPMLESSTVDHEILHSYLNTLAEEPEHVVNAHVGIDHQQQSAYRYAKIAAERKGPNLTVSPKSPKAWPSTREKWMTPPVPYLLTPKVKNPTPPTLIYAKPHGVPQ